MPRGALRRELTVLLRQGRARQRPRSRGEDRRGKLSDLLSIHVRPPEANDRLLPGHWEGDFIKGAGNHSAVGTLVDRYSLFVMLAKMDDCTAPAALAGFSTAFAPLDPSLKQTLTYDQGKEMALHAKLAESTGIAIYFADPHSPWQRGINENTNGLLRQYLPKGTDLTQYSQRQLDHIAWSLNTRPRKSLGFKTPAEVFFTKCFDRSSQSNTVALEVRPTACRRKTMKLSSGPLCFSRSPGHRADRPSMAWQRSTGILPVVPLRSLRCSAACRGDERQKQ
eukprot:gene52258-69903_t